MVDYIGIEQLILLTLANLGLIAYLASKIMRKRLRKTFFELGNDFLNTKLSEIAANPEVFSKFAKPLMGMMLKELGAGYGGETGMKLPKLTGNKFIDGLIASLVPRLVDKAIGSAGGAVASQNPFG